MRDVIGMRTVVTRMRLRIGMMVMMMLMVVVMKIMENHG